MVSVEAKPKAGHYLDERSLSFPNNTWVFKGLIEKLPAQFLSLLPQLPPPQLFSPPHELHLLINPIFKLHVSISLYVMPSISLVIIRTSERATRHWGLFFDSSRHPRIVHIQDAHVGYLRATGVIRQSLWASWSRYKTAIPISDFEESEYEHIVHMVRRIHPRSTCQAWAITLMAQLEASGLATWEIASWAAMEAHHQQYYSVFILSAARDNDTGKLYRWRAYEAGSNQ